MKTPRQSQVWSDDLFECVVVPFYAPFPTSYDPLRKPSNDFLQPTLHQHADPPYLDDIKLAQSLW